eukprot:69750_1
MIHMNDILTAIHKSDDKTTMSRLLWHINEEQYDTDSLVDDLHDDVAKYLNTTEWIRLKHYNYDEWMRNTKNIINDIWASHSTSNLSHSQSNLLQIDLRASHTQANTQYVTSTPTPNDTMIHMDDILAVIQNSDDKTAMGRLLSYLNEEEYDTDSIIDDLHDAVTKHMNKVEVMSLQGIHNPNGWMTDATRIYICRIIHDIWASHWTSNPVSSQSNLLQMDMKLLHSSEAIDPQCDGLSIELLHDIYNAHKCFLFANYHFEHYDVTQFAQHIQNCTRLNDNITKYVENASIANRITSTTINLYPSYVIDDDMYKIWKYFFSASHLVHNEMQNNNGFSLRMYVIPKRVICIYDNDIIIPFGIDDIATYLESKQMNAVKVNVARSKDIM